MATTVYSDAYASRPAASLDGDLFFPTDGVVIERDNAAAWVPWGPIFPFTPPALGDFSWVNQDTATTVTTYGGICMVSPPGSSGLHLLVKSAPAVPYTITAAFIFSSAVANYNHVGLAFRQSSDGKLHIFAHSVGERQLQSTKYTNPTTYSAHYVQPAWASKQLLWLRIADDNTNRICSISPDGQNWIVFHTIGRTDYITADQIGFFTSASNATYGLQATLLHWRED